MMCFQKKNGFLVPFTPEQNPLCWMLINILMFVWTTGHVIDYERSTVELSKRPRSWNWYLAWFVAGACVWILEAGLELWYFRNYDTDPVRWWVWAELVLAAYFFLDSIYWCYAWTAGGVKPRDEIWELSLNFVCYFFLAIWMAYRMHKKKRQLCNSNNVNEQDYEMSDKDVENEVMRGLDFQPGRREE